MLFNVGASNIFHPVYLESWVCCSYCCLATRRSVFFGVWQWGGCVSRCLSLCSSLDTVSGTWFFHTLNALSLVKIFIKLYEKEKREYFSEYLMVQKVMKFNHPSQVYRDCVLACVLTWTSFLIYVVTWIIELEEMEYTPIQNCQLARCSAWRAVWNFAAETKNFKGDCTFSQCECEEYLLE